MTKDGTIALRPASHARLTILGEADTEERTTVLILGIEMSGPGDARRMTLDTVFLFLFMTSSGGKKHMPCTTTVGGSKGGYKIQPSHRAESNP